MEEQATPLAETAVEYVDRWNRLISTTNWEKGRIILEWREALQRADSPAACYTDEAWSRRVGGVTPQHVGRLRRVYERFGQVFNQYPGLYWSHFQAAYEWPDAEMYLQGAVDNGWSVAQMREQRWEAIGGAPQLKPLERDIIALDLDEDVLACDDGPLPTTISETDGEVHSVGNFGDDDFGASPQAIDGDDTPDTVIALADAPASRPFESLPPLPPDLNEAMELMKLAILNHKVSGWREITRKDVLAVLESLRQLALAPTG